MTREYFGCSEESVTRSDPQQGELWKSSPCFCSFLQGQIHRIRKVEKLFCFHHLVSPTDPILSPLPGKELKPGPWAHLLDKLPDFIRFSTMLPSWEFLPTPLTMVLKGQIPPYSKNHDLMCHSPVVADSKIGFGPNEDAFVIKIPSLQELLTIK